jgi:hypothetical protein
MSSFGTNPDNPQVQPRLVGDFDFAEAFTTALVELGIEFYYARIASIDLKHLWIPLWKNGLAADKTANLLYGDVISTYHLNKPKEETK